MQIISNNEQETLDFAVKISPILEIGDILCLYGDLGAGKSTFARALIRELSGSPKLDIPSPTFTLMQRYDTQHGAIAHFDLYRIKNPEEIYELGWDDAISEGITLVEWPERLEMLAPASRLDIVFSHIKQSPEKREIMLNPQGNWKERDLSI